LTFAERYLRTCRWLLAVCTVGLFSVAADGQELEDRVTEHVLDNGMKFLLVERHETPVFSAYIIFKAGSVDEPAAQSGIAHMFEHMAFKGTTTIATKDYAKEKPLLDEVNRIGRELTDEQLKGENADPEKVEKLLEELAEAAKKQSELIVKDELDEIYSRNGADMLNAGTGADTTTYYVSLPSNRLELWASLESDRLINPVLREFYSERDVVMEERRLRYETSPFGKLMESFRAAAFVAHPYGDPTIGWSSDIAGLTVEDAESFRTRYYVPHNAVCAIVGDIDTEATIELVGNYFGRIPKGEPARDRITDEPAQEGERRTDVQFDAQPQLLIGYHKPTLPHFDDYVFDVVDSILSRGRSSRLYESLIKEQQVAVAVETWQGFPGARFDNLFVFSATPRHPHTAQQLEDAIYAQIEKLVQDPPSDKEMQKVRNQLRADFVRDLDSNSGLASKLAYFEAVGAGWRYAVTHREMIEKVTREDVVRVVNQYLTKANRTVATLVPVEEKPPPPVAEQEGAT